MTTPTPPATFNCPHCGAPIQPKLKGRSMKCPFCEATVPIPKELRTYPSEKAPATAGTSSLVGKGCIWGILALVGTALLAVLILVFGGYYAFLGAARRNPMLGTAVADVTSGFARQVLVFGSKGTGPGTFASARSVAVDAKGNILVGDYGDDRVQTFDPSGKYISTFSIGAGDNVDALLAGPDGKAYVGHSGTVSIYSPSGEDLGQVENARGAEAMAFGPDGSLYILTGDDTIKRLDASGKVTLTVPDAFSSVLGEGESTTHIAVDKSGDIYIIGDTKCIVLKYSPQGKYLLQFGGKARSSGPAVPGTVFNPSGLVVDDYGRVFISDWNTDVEVFYSNGKYIQSIDAVTLGFTTLVYGINSDAHGRIFLAAGDKIMVLQIQAAQQQ